jgi:hypothetical protein
VEVDDSQRFSMLELMKVERIISEVIGVPVQAEMRRSLEPRFAERIADDVIEVF